MSDPFGDDTIYMESQPEVPPSEVGRSGLLLPIGLAVLVFFGAKLPWIVVRPFGAKRHTYNMTDVPGGTAILILAFIVALSGFGIAISKRRVGLTIASIAVGAVGWLATISGLMFNVVGSLIPSIDVAGIDLGKAQVGQGYGVVMSVAASLLMGLLTLRMYEPFGSLSQDRSIRLVPVIAAVPIFLIAANFHAVWIHMESDSNGFKGGLPGDSLMGSGIIITLMYVCVGLYLLAVILQTYPILVFTSVIAFFVAGVCGFYALVVWIGGKSINWLLPSNVENWTNIEVRPALYVTFAASVLLGIVAVIGIIPNFSKSSIPLGKDIAAEKRVFTIADAIGLTLVAGCALAALIATLT